MADYHVVITHTHGDYQRGDIVTDERLVESLLKDHPHRVAKITPEPAPERTKRT